MIKSVGGIEIGTIGTDCRVLRVQFPHRKNRYVGCAVRVNESIFENEKFYLTEEVVL